ncbi:type II toxin-antitoxin system VapB family antitoxin [Arthrobacter psychrolactophilus]
MAITSVDIDKAELNQAKRLAGTTSTRETVDLALRTLIAVRQQPAVVERIISRSFEPSQVDAPTISPTTETPHAGKIALPLASEPL